MSQQIPMSLDLRPSFSRIDYALAACNRDAAHGLLDRPPLTPPGGLLVGPAGAGKTHLAHIWAGRHKGAFLDCSFDAHDIVPGSFWVAEDIDRRDWSEEALFHLYNWAREQGAVVLFTARVMPADMAVTLPDLRSRLHILPVFQVHAPNDEMLETLLVKLLADRQLSADAALLRYVLPRMERSYAAALRLVERLDRLALAENRKLTRALARRVLETSD